MNIILLSDFTQKDFIFRAIICILISIILGLITFQGINTWYPNANKAEWAPDGVVIMIITGFLLCNYVWVWYKTYTNIETNKFLIDILFTLFLILFLGWSILYYQENLFTLSFWVLFCATMLIGGLTVYTCSVNMIDETVMLTLICVWMITLLFVNRSTNISPSELGQPLPGVPLLPQRVQNNVDPGDLD